MPTIKRVEIIDKKKFAKIILDKNVKAFVMYIIFLSLNLILINLAKKAKIATLITKKVKISTDYSEFLDVFLEEKALVLLEITDLNQNAIKLQKN